MIPKNQKGFAMNNIVGLKKESVQKPPSTGEVDFYDGFGNVIEAKPDSEIDTVICFTPGTMIATAAGMRPVEDIKVGERLITRDNGFQELAWVGRRDLSFDQLSKAPQICPVTIAAGSLGNGLPVADLTVSPNHRLFILSAENRILFDEAEVLVPAKQLVGRPGITQAMPKSVSYIHLMCEQHELILSDSFWTESFQPKTNALLAIESDQRDELLTIFPELREERSRLDYYSARLSLHDHESQVALDAMSWA